MLNEKQFETADIGLAAALISHGLILERIDKSNPKRVLFVFEESAYTKSLVASFWDKKLLVPALLLMENLRNLKTRIYA